MDNSKKYYRVGTLVSYGVGKITDEIVCKTDNTLQADKVCEMLNNKNIVLNNYANIVNDLKNKQLKDAQEKITLEQDYSNEISSLKYELNMERRLRAESTALCKSVLEKLDYMERLGGVSWQDQRNKQA